MWSYIARQAMEDEQHTNSGSDEIKPAEPTIKRGWLRALIFVVAYPFFLVAQAVLMLVISGFKIDSVEEFAAAFDKPIMVLIQAATLLLTLVYIWLFRRFIDRRSLVSLGLSFGRQIRKDFVMGLIWGAAMATAVFGLFWIFGLAHIRHIQFSLGSLLMVAVTMAFTAAQEELLMRGYLLNNLMQSTNKFLSLLLVSVVFTVVHAQNPNLTVAAILNIILAGLCLGIYYIYRKNLWFPIGLHIAWNWFQGPVFGSPVSGIQMQSIFVIEFTGNKDLTGGGFGFEGSLVMTLVAAITVVILYFIYRRSRNSREVELSDSAQLG
jgi:membrane protease YdiL (CAAX protease family)